MITAEYAWNGTYNSITGIYIIRYEMENDADMGYDTNKEFLSANTFRYI